MCGRRQDGWWRWEKEIWRERNFYLPRILFLLCFQLQVYSLFILLQYYSFFFLLYSNPLLTLLLFLIVPPYSLLLPQQWRGREGREGGEGGMRRGVLSLAISISFLYKLDLLLPHPFFPAKPPSLMPPPSFSDPG